MAATNSIEELLSSEVDENEVSALVGSLESRLASPTHKESSQDVTDSVVTPISAPATSDCSGNTNTNNDGSNNVGNASNNSSKVGCGIGTTSATGTNHINNTGTSPCVGTNIGIGGTTTATVMAVASGLSPLQPTSSTVSSPFASIQAVSQGQKGISLVTAGGTQVNKNTQSLAKAPIDAQIIGISSILSSTPATTTATGSIISTVSPANVTGTTTTTPGTSSGVSLLGINTPNTAMQVPTNGGGKLGNTPTIRIINQGTILTSTSSAVSTNNSNTQSQNVTYVHALTRPLGPGQPQPAHVATTDSNCIVTQNAPVVSTGVTAKQGNHTASSAMYNLASIAAERKPLAVPPITVQQAKSLQVGSRVTVREQIDQRQDKTGVPKITTTPNTSVTTTTPLIKTDSSGGHVLIKDVSKTDSTCTRDALTRATTTVVTVPQQNVHIVKSMNNSNLITVSRAQTQSVAVVPPQILTTPTQMRIVTVNNQIQAARALTVNAGNLGKTTNSRVGTVRINPSQPPQQISIAPRPGGTNAITLPTSIQLQPGTVLVKNDQGQLVLVQASQASVLQPQTTTNTAVLPGKLHNAKTVTTQGQPRQQTPTILTIQQPQGQVPTTTHHTVLRHSVPVNHTPIVSLHNSNVSTVSQTATATTTTVPGSVSVTQAGGVMPGQNSNMIDNVRKCKNFMATLLKLASNQRPETIMNVRDLIQGLIDGKVDPESFTEKLQIELQSSPQPYLVPFLKKSLPLLRQSLYLNKMSIEGVRPPPHEVLRQQTASPIPTTTTVTSTRQTVQNQTQNRVTSLPVTTTNLAGQPQVHSVVSSTHLHQPTQVSISCTNTMHARNMKINQPKTIVKHQICPGSQVGHVQVRGHPGKVTTTTTMAHTGITMNKGNFSTVSSTTGKTNLLNTLPTPVSSLPTHMPIKKELPSTHKEKRKYESLKEDDDINDVATMGGVNLSEETRNIMATNAEFIGTQTRSCKDECFLYHSPLSSKTNAIAKKFGIDEVPSDVINLISHATQERLRDFLEKLSTIAEHRSEIYKMDSRYEVKSDVRAILKHFEELDRLEKKRHEEQEREMLLRVAKSRSKHEDPEQLKLKQKAKELQQAEMEEMRQREANITALAAIGPRKKRKIEMGDTGQSGTSSSLTNGLNSSPLRPAMSRPRIKRVNLKDLIFLMEQDRSLCRSAVLYKTFFK